MSGVWGCSLLFPAKKNLHPGFARLSPVFVMLGFVLTIAAAPVKTTAGAAATAVKRPSASAQFARAEEQRAALNSKPTEKRTLADYKLVVTAYRRVASVTPRTAEAPDSLRAIAELYTEMGDRFGRNYYQSAADSYQFLVHEYPTSKHCQDAILRVAKLQRDQLGDATLAKKTYEDFLKRYPRSPRKREAQEALAELALLQNDEGQSATNSVAPDSTAALPTAEAARASAPVHAGGKSVSRPGSREIPRVRRIRADANGDATRLTIDLDDSVQYASGRIANPDRIFFDLHVARLTPEVARGNIRVDGRLLTAVRVAQSHGGVVRVVLDVNGVKDYSASLTSNPPQLLIDLYGNPPGARIHAAKGKPGQETALEDSHEGVAADGEARAVQNAPAKGSAGDMVSLEQPAENTKSTISGTINGSAINGGAANGSTAGRNSSAVPRNSLPSANIANQAKADLFISIHANSSRDHAARGIETYYLNLKGSAEAMEVAARENATAQGGVHELQDLVLKIARTEKIDESKELAEDIQDSLSKRIQKTNKPVKNRGVRKAPFVVLIGADMPSILTEISFLSNPADEQMLKKPEQRQKVAEGLYQGVVGYLESMNSVTMNRPAKTGAGHASAAAVEQSRNQN